MTLLRLRSVEVMLRDGVIVVNGTPDEIDPTFTLYEVAPDVWRETLTNETWPG